MGIFPLSGGWKRPLTVLLHALSVPRPLPLPPEGHHRLRFGLVVQGLHAARRIWTVNKTKSNREQQHYQSGRVGLGFQEREWCCIQRQIQQGEQTAGAVEPSNRTFAPVRETVSSGIGLKGDTRDGGEEARTLACTDGFD